MMKIIKYIIISFFSIIILILIFNKLFSPQTIMIMGDEYSLEKPWRKPTENENITLNRLITDFEFTDCETLYVREINSETLILACFKNDKKWDFYWATPKYNDIMILSDEIKEELTPPK